MHTQQHIHRYRGSVQGVSVSSAIVVTYSIYRWWVRIQTSIS